MIIIIIYYVAIQEWSALKHSVLKSLNVISLHFSSAILTSGSVCHSLLALAIKTINLTTSNLQLQLCFSFPMTILKHHGSHSKATNICIASTVHLFSYLYKLSMKVTATIAVGLVYCSHSTVSNITLEFLSQSMCKCHVHNYI